jgi:hypothetical protein
MKCKRFTSCLTGLFLVCSLNALAAVAPSGLLCNLLTEPDASLITEAQPDFGWIVSSSEPQRFVTGEFNRASKKWPGESRWVHQATTLGSMDPSNAKTPASGEGDGRFGMKNRQECLCHRITRRGRSGRSG